jgi:ACS family hexuronate transporter-like MFS transporter
MGLIWLVLWLMFYQPPHRSRFVTREEYDYLKDRVQPPSEAAPSRTSFREWIGLLRQRGCYPLILARFFTDPVIYFLSFWLPEYLQKERGFDLAMVGRYAWVPFLFGDIGYLTGGWVSGRLLRRGWPLAKARGALLLAAACLTPCAIFAPRVPGAGMAIALTCAVTFAHALWISNLLTLPTDLFPASRVGAVSGWSGMGGALGGVLANLATGWIVQHFSYTPVFTAAGLVHPLGFLIVLFLLLRRLPVR